MDSNFDRSTAFFSSSHTPALQVGTLPPAKLNYQPFFWVHGLLASRSISDGAKLTGLGIWKWASPSGYCYPNQTEIASARGIKSTGRISQHVKELKLAGLLTVDYARGNGKWLSANYQLHLPTTEGTN